MTPRQTEILFPPPFTERQLAAAAELERMVEERRASFEVRQFVERRRAGKQGWRNRRHHPEPES